MKITAKNGTLYGGKVVSYNDKVVTLDENGNTLDFLMQDKAAENFEKCNVKEGTFITLFVVDGKVDNFKFTGRYDLLAEFKKKDTDETYTTRINVFVGMAARVSKFDKLVQVSMPVKKKEDTEWYALNFFYGSTEEYPLDLGEKAELELTPVEGEAKKYFWAVTGAPRKFTDKKGKERETYTVRQFDTFVREPKQ